MPFSAVLRCIYNEIDLQASTEENVVDFLMEKSVSVLGFLDYLLREFVIANFLGGYADTQLESPQNINLHASVELTCEGEVPFKKAKHVSLLWLCDRISRYMCGVSRTMLLQYVLCSLKCIYLHQYLLGSERSPRLNSELDILLKICAENGDFTDENFNPDLICFYVLASYLCVFYYRYETGDQLAMKCADHLCVSVNFTGALGKRTKFQSTDVANLLVIVDRNSRYCSNDDLQPTVLPKSIPLNDDVLLNSVIFTNPDPNVCKTISVYEQSLLLLLCEIFRLAQPKEETSVEQRLTFLNSVIQQGYPDNSKSDSGSVSCSTWPIATEALFHRSLIEHHSSRKLERSLAQLEELQVQFYAKEPPSTERGFDSFFFSRMPSVWRLDIEQARFLKTIGCHKSALDIFLRWDQWSDIIDCYTTLNMREKAEEAIRERIATGDNSPELYCALGDVTNNRDYYTEAWELSNHTSARAMRSLAVVYMYADKNYMKAIECFEKSLSINALQSRLLFSFGCCCLQANEFLKAESAFRRCVQLEPDNFEAWNNCASAAMLRGKKDVALVLMKEACKRNYENWRVWENITFISVDVGAFGDTIHACHRLLDLRNKFNDAGVLSVLSKAVLEDLPDQSGKPASKYRSKVLELFGRVTASTPDVADIWNHYAKLLLGEQPLRVTTFQRAIQHLRSAHRCRLQPSAGNWDQSAQRRSDVVDGLSELVNIALNPPVCQDLDLDIRAQEAFLESTIASLRLSLLSVVTQLKRVQQTTVNSEVVSEIDCLRERAEQLLDCVVTALDSKKSNDTIPSDKT